MILVILSFRVDPLFYYYYYYYALYFFSVIKALRGFVKSLNEGLWDRLHDPDFLGKHFHPNVICRTYDKILHVYDRIADVFNQRATFFKVQAEDRVGMELVLFKFHATCREVGTK